MWLRVVRRTGESFKMCNNRDFPNLSRQNGALCTTLDPERTSWLQVKCEDMHVRLSLRSRGRVMHQCGTIKNIKIFEYVALCVHKTYDARGTAHAFVMSWATKLCGCFRAVWRGHFLLFEVRTLHRGIKPVIFFYTSALFMHYATEPLPPHV